MPELLTYKINRMNKEEFITELDKLFPKKYGLQLAIFNLAEKYKETPEQGQTLPLDNVSQQRELFDAILDFSEELPMCTEDYHRSELWEKYKAENCG